MSRPFIVRIYTYAPGNTKRPQSVQDHQHATYEEALSDYAAQYKRSRTEWTEVLLLNGGAPLYTPVPAWRPGDQNYDLLRSAINPDLANQLYLDGKPTLPLHLQADARMLHNLHRLKMRVLHNLTLTLQDYEFLVEVIDNLQEGTQVPESMLFPGNIWNDACELERGKRGHLSKELHLDIQHEPEL